MLITSIPNSENVCKDHQFECISYDRNISSCIPREWVCDGQYDCIDMKDEENCEHKEQICDPKSEWKCEDGQCIYSSWRCDGDNDCTDGSDERGCTNNVCDDPNKFKIRKLQAEILGLGSVIRQLRQPGMHHAATQPLLCRKRADLECLVRRIPGNRPAE